jgi:hypothetical protein
LAARLPLEPRDVAATRRWLRSEAVAARELLDHTRVPVPEPVAIGEPGAGYPLPWSVQTWVPGRTASQDDPSESEDFAHDLAEFIEQVRAIDTNGRKRHSIVSCAQSGGWPVQQKLAGSTVQDSRLVGRKPALHCYSTTPSDAVFRIAPVSTTKLPVQYFLCSNV